MRWQGTIAFMAPRDRYDERDGRSPTRCFAVGHLARLRDRETYRGTWFSLSSALVGLAGDP
jgi:hypothetical protein